MDRVGLGSLAAGILCAAAVELRAPVWLWAIAAGVAVALLVYALLVRQEDEEPGSSGKPGGGSGPSQGPGSGSQYNNSKVFNVTVEGKGKADP